MNKKDIQQFFIERFDELFHKDTIDSYRVRNQNAYTILYELIEVIENWSDGKISLFDTVVYSIDESINLIRYDEALIFNSISKNTLINQLESFKNNRKDKKTDTCNSQWIVLCLKKLIKENKNQYMTNLFNKLESLLFSENDEIDDKDIVPHLMKLDSYITSLARQLLYVGFSKNYLYHLFSTFHKDDGRFDEDYRILKDELVNENKVEYIVIYQIYTKFQEIDTFENFTSDVQLDCKTDEKLDAMRMSFLKPSINRYFYKQKIKASDQTSAMKKAREMLEAALDVISLGAGKVPIQINDKGLIISTSSNRINARIFMPYKIDGTYSKDIHLSQSFSLIINRIYNNPQIATEVKDRISSAIRHLRIGNQCSELEQRFINYWIALEFIFSASKSGESTFSRVKTNLTTILTCSYAKRNLLNLNERLSNNGYLDKESKYWEQDNVDDFIRSVPSVLLKYRLLKMKSHLFNHSDKRKSYLSNHETNLSQHIVRIYRLRNQLIHDAAIKQDIEDISSNLRYYLVFLLNQMLTFYNNHDNTKLVSLEDFFFEYRLIKMKIKENPTFETIMSVPLAMDLLR